MRLGDENRYLSFAFDMCEEIDLSDPLGTLRIDGRAGGIEEVDIYLDSFLEALVTGLLNLAQEQETSVDLVDEPYPVDLRRTETGLWISCNEQTVEIEDPERFYRELRAMVQWFVEETDAVCKAKGNSPFRMAGLRGFIWSDMTKNEKTGQERGRNALEIKPRDGWGTFEQSRALWSLILDQGNTESFQYMNLSSGTFVLESLGSGNHLYFEYDDEERVTQGLMYRDAPDDPLFNELVESLETLFQIR